MTTHTPVPAQQDPISEAILLLTEEADSLSDCHTRTPGDWAGEPEAKAHYDHVLAVIASLSKLRAPVADERAAQALADKWDAVVARDISSGRPGNASSIRVLEAARLLRAALADPEAAEVDFLVRVLENLDTWRAEDWSELLERRPAILAMLRPMVMASAAVADERISDETLWSWAEQIMGGKEAHHVGRDRVLRFARAALASAPVSGLPERDTTKPAEAQGLFRKFDVRRTDGSDAPSGKHHGCRYFVLDVDHDAHASAALGAYADACASSHPDLARDLRERWGAPVAGEAAYYAVMHGQAPYGIFDSEAAAEACKEQGHPDAPFSVKPLYAAPQASEARCSYPSGDGSLRHPCAVHGGDHFRGVTKMVGASEAVRTPELIDLLIRAQAWMATARGSNRPTNLIRLIDDALSAQPGAQKGKSDA